MSANDLTKYVDASVRLVLDDISYSNVLPPWHDVAAIDYAARHRLLVARIEQYLSERVAPKPATRILVPRKGSAAKMWLFPTVNDQIIVHACTMALADRLELIIDRTRVFSYRLNTRPGLLAFIRPQIESWVEFQSDTRARISGRNMLQLDLELAFASIERRSFLAFLRNVSGDNDAVDLLGLMLRSFDSSPGLPLINDSLFYLGNAYLTTVDREVAALAPDSIRFVDDYRIFAPSREALEALLETLSVRLGALGFHINARKLKVGDEYDYIAAINGLREPLTEENEAGYISSMELRGVVDAGQLAALVARIIYNPGEFTEGMGRFVMQAVRRRRLNENFRSLRNELVSKTFGEALALAVPVPALLDTMKRYSADRREEWRLIWLLYLSEDLGEEVMKQCGDAIVGASLSDCSACWVARARRGGDGANISIDEEHDAGYVDVGRALYGAP